MKRTFALTFFALVSAALFAAAVYAVLRLTHLSGPAATTIHGATGRRLWATGAAVLALASVAIAVLTARRSGERFASAVWRYGTLVAGLAAALNGGLVLAVANGGPGSGNGVVGGAAALVLGLAGAAVSGTSLARVRAAS